MSARYKIRVDGCDDSTKVRFQLTPEQYRTLQMVALAVTENAVRHCQPTMSIEKDED